jgi:hypothetical protein
VQALALILGLDSEMVVAHPALPLAVCYSKYSMVSTTAPRQSELSNGIGTVAADS